MTGKVIPFPLADRGERAPPIDEPGLSVWQGQLMAMAIYAALTDEQRVKARGFLASTDPRRTDPATERIERLFRRIRQIS